jgi:phosphoglycerol transferase MdoB-like AlkP superfamily enzyme
MAYFIIVALLIKYFYVRTDYFGDFNLARTLIEIIPFVFLVTFLQLLPFPRRVRNLIWICIDFIVSVLLFASGVYFNYYGDLFTHYSFAYLNQVGHVKDSVFSILNPTYLIYFFDIPLFVTLFIINKSIEFNWFKLGFKSLITLSLIFGSAFSWQVAEQVNKQSDSNIHKAYKDGVSSF